MHILQGTDDPQRQYLVKFIPENETLALISSESDMVTVQSSEMMMMTVDAKLRKKLRNCDKNSERVTPCITKGYDLKFGDDYNKRIKTNFMLVDNFFGGTANEKTGTMHVILTRL